MRKLTHIVILITLALMANTALAQLSQEVVNAAGEVDSAIGAIIMVAAAIALALLIIHWKFAQDKSKAKSLTIGFVIAMVIMGVLSSDMVPFLSENVRKMGSLNKVTDLLK